MRARGVQGEQVTFYVAESLRAFRRGTTVKPVTDLPIEA